MSTNPLKKKRNDKTDDKVKTYDSDYDVLDIIEESDDAEETVKTKKSKKKLVGMVFARIGISIATLLVLIVIGLFGVVAILQVGPSEAARNIFVNSAMESSMGGFVCKIFFSDEEIAQIRALNSVEKTEDVTDSSLISDTSELTESEKDFIEIIDLDKDTYKGKMMIVRDPSRVSVGISGEYGRNCSGRKVSEIAESYGAIAATNAGGFYDAGGVGLGGEPDGLVISDGELKWGNKDTTYEVIGIDKNNVLVVGNMTAAQALDRGVRDAVSFGPILIVNNEAVEINGKGSGLNPRTAIGQREDGSILLAVIDGRQVNSLGASYSDVIDLMLEYGAVNAANLDGGSSSLLYYKGEYINSCASMTGPRDLPTTIIVK